ncbi:hypothetical protein [Acinetobacter sp. MD2(2019)]|uniref:hypothetical protein n=1 Tax=Acinetobacter sp. MD2(2019) TaxID=2605273 RepID=UPI002D1F1EA1|nr:hypothetical protein [Acinetobacter sp. MD2(2019)]MEB3754865.1 hypothetical protein [Acinetobacter sp. MD2(2019)]
MSRVFFIFGLYFFNLSLHAGVVEDILNKKVKIDTPKPVYKYDIYQCGVSQSGQINFNDWKKCLDRENPDKINSLNNIDRTNDLYSILVSKYKLKKGTKCKVYSVKNGHNDDDFSKFEKNHRLYNGRNMPEYQFLGENDEILRAAPSSLDKDLYNDVRDVALLRSQEITSQQQEKITSRFQKRHRFIEKSCGKEFVTAFNAYLNDYANFATEQYVKEAEKKKSKSQKVTTEKQNKNLAIQLRPINKEQDEIESLINTKKLQMQLNEESIGICKASTNYQIYQASNKILISYRNIEHANQALKNEQDRKKNSGLVNPDVQDMATKIIQHSKQDIDDSFSKYRKAGGLATSAKLVKTAVNPCKTT